MIRKTSMYFRPLNTSIYNRGQVTSRSRLACATSCFESNYCQTLTFIIEQNLCLLFGDPLDEGILISNASAETVFLANRNPLLCDPPCSNSGKCIRRNNCSCPNNFMGAACQYPMACSLNNSFVGTRLFLTTFDSGSSQYSLATPANYSFSTNYSQSFGTVTENGQFSFVNAVPSLGSWHTGAGDHTENDTNGYMFLINSGYTASEMYRRQVDNLCVGLQYEFSFYGSNTVGSWGIFDVSPNIQVSIRSADVNQTLLFVFTTGTIAAYGSMTWARYSFPFVVPTSSIIFSFTSTATGNSGNDIAIDDINFGICTNSSSGICL